MDNNKKIKDDYLNIYEKVIFHDSIEYDENTLIKGNLRVDGGVSIGSNLERCVF